MVRQIGDTLSVLGPRIRRAVASQPSAIEVVLYSTADNVREMEQAKMEPAMKLIDLVVALSVLQGLDPTRARVAAIEVSGLSGR